MTTFTPQTNEDFINGIRHYYGGATLTIGSNGDDYTGQNIGLYNDSTSTYISSWDISNVSMMSNTFDVVKINTDALTGVTSIDANGDVTMTNGNLVALDGNITSSTGTVSGNSLTDGVATLTNGAFTNVSTVNNLDIVNGFNAYSLTIRSTNGNIYSIPNGPSLRENIYILNLRSNIEYYAYLPKASQNANSVITVVEKDGLVESNIAANPYRTIILSPKSGDTILAHDVDYNGSSIMFKYNHQSVRLISDGVNKWYSI